MKAGRRHSENSNCSIAQQQPEKKPAGKVGYAAPAQFYIEAERANLPCRISNNGNLGTTHDLSLRDHLWAREVEIAQPVLTQVKAFDSGTRVYKTNIATIHDCGGYATALLKKIHGFVDGIHTIRRTIVNAQGGPKNVNPFNYVASYDEDEQAPPAPGVGQVFFAVNDPKDPLIAPPDSEAPAPEKKHYNFHWAAVVAKDDTDVVTAEADSKVEKGMWFQMYSISDAQQSFGNHYQTIPMLAEKAKFFQVKFELAQKQQQMMSLELSDDSDDDTKGKKDTKKNTNSDPIIIED